MESHCRTSKHAVNIQSLREPRTTEIFQTRCGAVE